ncbi:MAG: MCP four helix bundle domain-containing protein [Bacteroidales bacterium]|nr:MCP four helix bundle domain-containing protein [Bacteroidales bacterium]
MKINDLKISSQFKYGLGIIVVLVGILGAVAWYHAALLWEETEGMYQHPLQVRRSIEEIRVDILNIALEMKELFLVEDSKEREKLILTIDEHDASAARYFEILYKQYLGPVDDIDSCYALFVQWRTIRAETYRLLREGKVEEAENRAKITGIQGSFIDRMMTAFQKVSKFQIARGDQFYQDALTHQKKLSLRLGILLGVILLVILGISYFLLRGIRHPLSDLLIATKSFGEGNLDARSRYVGNNEFGQLASAFNSLAETISGDVIHKEQVLSLSQVMLQEENLKDFCNELMKALMEKTNSQVAAIYLLNEDRSEYVHFASIGLSAKGWISFSASDNEGEFGAVLSTKKICHIKKIPKDSRFVFSTVTGEFIPREIVTIPVLSGKEVVAMISLSSLRNYTQAAIDLLHAIYLTMTARINGVVAFGKLEEFLSRLEQQNFELESQQTELTQQKDELNEQNIELEMQKHQLDDAVKTKNKFLARMSHELRTPLNSILALTGVLARRLKTAIAEEEYSYLGIISRNGKQLLELINDILELSRIESGMEKIRPGNFFLAGLIDDVVSSLKPQAEEKNIELIADIPEKLPEITSDYAKCMHILQNILANAVKFTEKGRVVISVATEQEMVRISVEDTGIGITQEQLPYIFDEFRQADEGFSRKFGGTGLGLAIARRYATLLQGEISVESEHGKGSRFPSYSP